MKKYKEPVFLFTSGSLRFDAWAGWYSALGDEKNCEMWSRQATSEWCKEIGACRNYSFLKNRNDDIWRYVSLEKQKER
ncbi:MAG: hypothetical protein ABII21_01955 [bacterium]